MIDKKARRVVIINNIQSDTIDQAIFILKSDKSDSVTFKKNADISHEAQRIINNYIRQVERLKSAEGNVKPHKNRQKLKMPGWVSFFLTAGAITAFIFLTLYIL